MLEAVGFQAGIEVKNAMAISVRGSTPDELSYMVDGFEQTNPVENRSYTSMNKEIVQEVQVLTGAFSAEYFARAAVVNVVTRDPGARATLSGDFRWSPAQKKHFGPSAYADDEFDRVLYRTMVDTDTRNGRQLFFNAAGGTVINSNDPVYYSRSDAEQKGELAFRGWNDLLAAINAGTYNSSDPAINNYAGTWTKEALIEYWDYQHRPIAYGADGKDDHLIDAALSVPFGNISGTGLIFGFRDVRQQYAVPAVVSGFTDRRFDLTFKARPVDNLKIQLSGFHETIGGAMAGLNPVTEGGVGSYDPALFFSSYEGSNQGASLWSTYLNAHTNLGESGAVSKYYVAGNVPYEEKILGFGFSATHTPMSSMYYTISYNRVQGATNGRHPWDGYRDLDSEYELTEKNSNGDPIMVNTDAPRGWLASEGLDWGGHADVTNTYLFTGGGYVTDFSTWSYDRLRVDAFAQVDQHHGVKAGAELVLNDINKDLRRMSRSFGRLGDFAGVYEADPWQVGFYIQDKMEYEGLIVNAGIRLDGYNAGWDKLYPDELVPMEFRKGGLVSMIQTAGLEVWPDNYPRNLSWQYVPLSQNEDFQRTKKVMALMPSEPAKTYWKVAPRLGISHPVGTSTKFFFNFGWMYSLPKTGYRYGIGSESFMLTSMGSEIRAISNPNLTMPRSVQYEVGFEQSLQNMYLLRVKGYSKDDDDMPGRYRATGYDKETQVSHQISAVTSNRFSTNRGLELTLSKNSGRFVTGTINLDYRVVSSGQKGYATVYHEDMNTANAPFQITSGQSQVQPSVDTYLGLHTPSDYGHLTGSWHLSMRQVWQRGGTYDYDPTGSGIPVTLRWVDYWRTDLRLTKDIPFDQRSVSFYMDIRNLFNNKRLSLSSLELRSGGRYEDYMALLIEADPGTGLYNAKEKLGDDKFNSIAEQRIVRDNDWLMYDEQPRFFQFGMRVSL